MTGDRIPLGFFLAVGVLGDPYCLAIGALNR